MSDSSHRIARDFRLPLRLCRFSARRRLWWSLLAIGMVAGRIALLPLIPAPEPVAHDEYSYLLAADTFSHGRLTNPPLPHPEFFESPHILLHPFYGSKYPPGQGLVLALGQKLGQPYWGVMLSGALMVFLFCWACDPWLPPQWTLVAGGLSFVLFFPHYWFNTYFGGSVAACGGALIIGGVGNLLRGRLAPARFTLALGAVILYATRPYEGGVFCAAVLAVLLLSRWRTFEKARLWRVVVLPNLALLAAAAVLAGWYNWRITGHVWELPYVEHVRQYDPVPLFWFLPPPPKHQYSSASVTVLHDWETTTYRSVRSLSLPRALFMQLIFFSLAGIGQQFRGFGLLLLMLPWTRLGGDRKKWLILLFGAGVAALLPEVFVQAHYTAPFTAVELILIVACARALWYRMGASRFGGLMFLGLALVCLPPLALEYTSFIQKASPEREPVVRELEARGGRHLVFVEYDPGWSFYRDWVYNGASLDDSPVVFAHDMGVEKDRELLPQFANRTVWYLRAGPEPSNVELEPYTALTLNPAGGRATPVTFVEPFEPHAKNNSPGAAPRQ